MQVGEASYPACFGVKAWLELVHMGNSLPSQFSPLCQGLAHLPEFLLRLLHSIPEIQTSEADTIAFCYLST